MMKCELPEIDLAELVRQDPLGAIRYVSSVLQENVENVELLLFRAEAYRTMNNLERAMDDLNRVVCLQPSALAYVRRGLIRDLQLEHALACRDFTHALVYDSEDPEIYIHRANSRAACGQLELSQKDLQIALQLTRRRTLYLFNAAVGLLDSGARDMGVAVLSEALSSGHEQPSLCVEAGKILARYAVPLHTISVVAGEVWHHLSLHFADAGDVKNALYCALRAEHADSNSALFNFNLANLYWKVGQLERAEQFFRRALDLAPEDAGVLCNLGLLLCEAGQMIESEALIRRATVNHPDDPDAWYNLAVCLSQAGDERGSVDAMIRVVQLSPGDMKSLETLERQQQALSTRS